MAAAETRIERKARLLEQRAGRDTQRQLRREAKRFEKGDRHRGHESLIDPTALPKLGLVARIVGEIR